MDDIAKTVLITPFGLYELCHMPFGLRNAAQIFQWFIDNVYRDLDDILAASSSLDEHLQHLQTLFQHLSDHVLVINPAKWEFGKSEVHFLSHTISTAGILLFYEISGLSLLLGKPAQREGARTGLRSYARCSTLPYPEIPE